MPFKLLLFVFPDASCPPACYCTSRGFDRGFRHGTFANSSEGQRCRQITTFDKANSLSEIANKHPYQSLRSILPHSARRQQTAFTSQQASNLLLMAGTDLISVADKRLALAEAGGIEEFNQHLPQAPRGPGIGNPAPLGLLCFGMTTVMLMFITTTWAEEATIAAVISYACFYGGFGQMVAGVLELIKGNTFAGTAFFSYGAFWMAFFVMKFLIKTTATLGAAAYSGHFQIGETLIMVLWGIFTTGFFVPTLRKNGCLMFVFGSLAITFFLLAGGQWSKPCLQAAGYMGFVCGSSAIYTAFAEIWQESLGLNMPGLHPVRFI